MSATTDGYLTIVGLSKELTRWVEVAPLVFQQVGGHETLAFRADDQDRITYLFQGNLPIYGYRKLAWYETLPLHYGLLLGCIVLFLSTLLIWPIGWLVARRKGAPRPRLAGLARLLAGGISALYLLFLVLLVVGISDVSVTLLEQAALVVALAPTALTAGLVACAGLAWKRHYWSLVGRAHYTLVTLGALAFIWFLNYWNLLGFRW